MYARIDRDGAREYHKDITRARGYSQITGAEADDLFGGKRGLMLFARGYGFHLFYYERLGLYILIDSSYEKLEHTI